jgi:hypothetical protein
LILAHNATSVTHPAAGVFCVVLADAVHSWELTPVATLDYTNDRTTRYQASSIEIARDTINDCGNLNGIDVRTFSMTTDQAGAFQVFPLDASFSFVVA